MRRRSLGFVCSHLHNILSPFLDSQIVSTRFLDRGFGIGRVDYHSDWKTGVVTGSVSA